MPQLGETVTEGTIIRWLKKVGDEVAYDEPLFEVSTDKVDSEVPSPASGHLAEILVAEGATVDVGTKLAVVTDEAPSGAVPAGSAEGPAVVATPPDLQPRRCRPRPRLRQCRPSPRLPPMPPEPAPRRRRQPDLSEPSRAERNGAVSRRPAAGRRVRHRPGSIPGTGKGGRITRADVLSFIDRRATGGGAAAEPATPPTGAKSAATASRSGAVAAGLPVTGSEIVATDSYTPVAGARDEVVPFTKYPAPHREHMVGRKRLRRTPCSDRGRL